MKLPILILFISLVGCKSTRLQPATTWLTTPTNNTSKIKVVTNYYGGYERLHAHSVSMLTHLGFEIDNNNNPIITKPKMLFARLVRYSIHCDSVSIIITGEIMESALGGLSNVNAGNFSGKPIVKGTGHIGTVWYEKMLVVAEGTHDGTIYYSNN